MEMELRPDTIKIEKTLIDDKTITNSVWTKCDNPW